MAGDTVPSVSIIVVNLNGKHFLGECFASLESLDYPRDNLEVILVDNASTDSSVEYSRCHFPWVRILELDRNYGFCRPNNEGVKVANGEYVGLLLGKDGLVGQNWSRG